MATLAKKKAKKKVTKKKTAKKKTKKVSRTYNFRALYRNGIAILSKGRMLQAFSCKDQLMRYIAHNINARNSKLNLTDFEVAYWCSPDTVERNAKKFHRMANRLEKEMGTSQRTKVIVPKCGSNDKSAAFVVKMPSFWFRNPIYTSLYFVLMCQSKNMKMYEKARTFFNRISKNPKTKENNYLANAKRRGTLKKIIEGKVLKKKKRHGWKGYRYGLGINSYRGGRL